MHTDIIRLHVYPQLYRAMSRYNIIIIYQWRVHTRGHQPYPLDNFYRAYEDVKMFF